MLITEEYRQLNAELHKQREDYGMSGQRWAGVVHDLATAMNTQDILDYGCGKSTLANNLPFAITQYDPAIEKYSEKPKACDLVVCTDVLEHIEPDNLKDVLDDIASLSLRAAFLIVATRPAKKTLPDGRNAHLIVKPARWWLAELLDRFDMLNFQAMDGEFMFTGTPL